MTLDEVAARFDNRTGYRLVDYGPVGLPLYRLTTIATCTVKKTLDPIEEFVLRCVEAGVHTKNRIAGVLGLAEQVVETVLTNLVGSECVQTDGSRFELTAKGTVVARDHAIQRPTPYTLVFIVDGLTRKPKFYKRAKLLWPKDLKKDGIPEIPAWPPQKPELGELDLGEIVRAVKLELGRSEDELQVLRIESIERKERVFLDAMALAYKSDNTPEYHIGFAIDGRISADHEEIFARHKLIERTPLFRELRQGIRQPSLPAILGEGLGRKVEAEISKVPMLEATEQQARAERASRLSAKLEDERRADIQEEPSRSAEKVQDDASVVVAPERVAVPVRPIAVYEHAAFLQDALTNAKDRVMIVSPWVRRAVVGAAFLRALHDTLKRGTRVYIGFGIGDEGEEGKPWDEEALKQLQGLAARYQHFVLRELGDTHAKVLIKDSDYFVISSFNWLSFKGDPRRPFREEWGTLVSIPSLVDEYFQTMLQRFQHIGNRGPSSS